MFLTCADFMSAFTSSHLVGTAVEKSVLNANFGNKLLVVMKKMPVVGAGAQ